MLSHLWSPPSRPAVPAAVGMAPRGWAQPPPCRERLRPHGNPAVLGPRWHRRGADGDRPTRLLHDESAPTVGILECAKEGAKEGNLVPSAARTPRLPGVHGQANDRPAYCRRPSRSSSLRGGMANPERREARNPKPRRRRGNRLQAGFSTFLAKEAARDPFCDCRSVNAENTGENADFFGSLDECDDKKRRDNDHVPAEAVTVAGSSRAVPRRAWFGFLTPHACQSAPDQA